MADYIYLLETRLSPAQQRAIGTVRTAARENDMTVFLTGGAVRDLTGGGSIRDLDLTIQGNALRLKQPLEQAGATVLGENTPAQRIFMAFPGSVRVEIASAMRVTYPVPGKPLYEPSNISDDLRSRDFTANAMAISLNEGSFGLLTDPLNGVADIENRELRLVSNYGFIEEPSRLIRAARLMSRLGWPLEERTRQHFDTAKDENYISALNEWNRGYETEEIFHEEDPLRILRALEVDGWSGHLFPALQSSKANAAALTELADRQGQLQVQGILAQSAALAFPLITGKLAANDVANLKSMFVRPGTVREIESLDGQVREFAARVGSKEAASPSAAWKILHEADPNLVLALYVNSKTANVQARLKTFLGESPAARQRIPYALLQEMRITPDLPGYQDLLDRLFFELMDGKLSTTEEMKAFLEPYSPPAPPPPVNLRRARAKKEARPSRAKAKKVAEPDPTPMTVAEEEEDAGLATGLMKVGDLTGPDRGPEPTPEVPMVGKVAPEPEVSGVELIAEIELENVLSDVITAIASSAPLNESEPAVKKPSRKSPRPPKKDAVPDQEIASMAPAVTEHAAPVKTVLEVPKPTKSSTSGKKSSPVPPVAAPVKPDQRAAKKAESKAPEKAPVKVIATPASATARKPAATKSIQAAKKVAPAKNKIPAKNSAAENTAGPGKKSVPATKATSGAKKSAPAKKLATPPATSTGTKKHASKSVVKKAAAKKQ